MRYWRLWLPPSGLARRPSLRGTLLNHHAPIQSGWRLLCNESYTADFESCVPGPGQKAVMEGRAPGESLDLTGASRRQLPRRSGDLLEGGTAPHLGPDPARSGNCYRIFPSVQFYFLDIPDFFHVWGKEGKFGIKRENSLTALKLPCPPRSTSQNVVPRHLVELQASTCTQCCISHGNCLKSQNWPSPCLHLVGPSASFA